MSDVPREIAKGVDRVNENLLDEVTLEARKDLQSKIADKAVVGDVLVAAPTSIEQHNSQFASRIAELTSRLPKDVLDEFVKNQRAAMDKLDDNGKLALEHNLKLLQNA